MQNIYYLYVKTHNKTGLKYLGRTKANPYTYLGSGIRWRSHIKKHGKDISTELIAAFDNFEDLKAAGQFWSKHWNIIKSKEWANLKEEAGDGGFFSDELKKKISDIRKTQGNFRTGTRHSEATIQKMKEAAKARVLRDGMPENFSSIGGKAAAAKGGGHFGKRHSEKSKLLMSKNRKDIIPNWSEEGIIKRQIAAIKSGLNAHKNKTGIHSVQYTETKTNAIKAKNNFLQKHKNPEFQKLHSNKIKFGRLVARFNRLPKPTKKYFGF